MGDLFQSINEGLLDHGEGLYQLKHFARFRSTYPNYRRPFRYISISSNDDPHGAPHSSFYVELRPLWLGQQ